MTRTHAPTSFLEQAQLHDVVERANAPRSATVDSFCVMLLAQAGALAIFSLIVFGLLMLL